MRLLMYLETLGNSWTTFNSIGAGGNKLDQYLLLNPLVIVSKSILNILEEIRMIFMKFEFTSQNYDDSYQSFLSCNFWARRRLAQSFKAWSGLLGLHFGFKWSTYGLYKPSWRSSSMLRTSLGWSLT